MTDDVRLYVKEPSWRALISRGDSRILCHLADDETGIYHRIAGGEIYLNRDTENYCLNCARKRGVVTTERPALADRQLLALASSEDKTGLAVQKG